MARLGELERKVMEVLWARLDSELTAREVNEQLPGYAYTTLLTVLDRLHTKGVVRRTRDGRAFRYAAMGSREDHTAELMHDALGVAGDRHAVLVRFAETVSATEAAVLREALADLAGRDDKERGPKRRSRR
jgi:predicted transcriptional regulator